jgi:hypothetical protein
MGKIVHDANSCMRRNRCVRLSVVRSLAALLLGLSGAMASPLDKASCDQLKLEQGQLEQGGVRTSMAKGPEWAKGNLKPEQLEQVRRVIEVDGQLLFRCNGRPLVVLPKDLEEPREDGSEPPKAKGEENAVRPAPEQPAAGKAATDKAATDKAATDKAATDKAATADKTAITDKTAARKAKPLPGRREQRAAAGVVASGKANSKGNPKAKPKADDAFKPPPTDPLADPFANKQPSDGKN